MLFKRIKFYNKGGESDIIQCYTYMVRVMAILAETPHTWQDKPEVPSSLAL